MSAPQLYRQLQLQLRQSIKKYGQTCWMIQNEGNQIWAESAYRSEAIEAVLALLDFDSQINERGYRNRPLTEAPKEMNRDKFQIRAKVEHVFGHWVKGQAGKLIRCIGLQRVQALLGLKNLTYNLTRSIFINSTGQQLLIESQF